MHLFRSFFHFRLYSTSQISDIAVPRFLFYPLIITRHVGAGWQQTFIIMKKMLALLAACLWLAGCSGDGPDGGSGNLNIVFDCSMPLQVVAGETCEVGYTLGRGE